MTRQHEAGREEAQWEPGACTCSQRAEQEPPWTRIETETKEEREKETSTLRDDDDDHRTPVQAHECAHEG